jgi:AAA domain
LADVLSSEAFIERSIAPVVVEAMQSARAVALLGARQAGKSTLARVLSRGPMPADYVTLDSDPVRAAARADPDGFVATLGRSTVIDEVQRAPDLLLAVKARLDVTKRGDPDEEHGHFWPQTADDASGWWLRGSQSGTGRRRCGASRSRRQDRSSALARAGDHHFAA